MSLSDAHRRAALRLAALSLATLPLAGCFRPVYGDRAGGGGAAQTHMAKVGVDPIGGRFGIVLRNELIYGLTGGAGRPETPIYQLIVTPSLTATPTLIESFSGRQSSYQIILNGTYQLKDRASGRVLTTGHAVGGASVDKSAQVFAGDRGALEANDRAAKVLSEQIITQLAGFFATYGR